MKSIYELINKHIIGKCNQRVMINFFNKIEPRFSVSPASTKYHSNYSGGLLDHTVLVTKKAVLLAPIFNLTNPVDLHSIVKCSLLHDVGKIGSDKDDMYLVNTDPSKWDKEPYVYNEKLIQLPHEALSIKWCLDLGLPLTDEEFQAILYHNMYYKESAKEDLKYKECSLTLIVHTADNLVSKIFYT